MNINSSKKRFLILISTPILSLGLSGCIPVGGFSNIGGGQSNIALQEQQNSQKNFLIDLDMDLTLLKELAVLSKFNEMFLNYLPIDKQIDMLSVLNTEVPKEKEEALNKNLLNLAANDFKFFKLYNYENYMNFSSQSSNSSLLGTVTNFVGNKVLTGLINYLNTEVIKLKLTLINPNIMKEKSLTEPSKDNNSLSFLMKNIVKTTRITTTSCPLTAKSLEDAIEKAGGLDKFIETDLGKKCIKSSDKKESFREKFYSLLPSDLRDKIKELDEKLAKLTLEQKNLEGKIKELEELEKNKENSKQIKELKEKLAKIEAEIDKSEELRDKLYDKAMEYVEKHPEFAISKLEEAKKLKAVTEYVNNNLNKVAVGVAALTVKIFNDVKTAFANLGKNIKNQAKVDITNVNNIKNFLTANLNPNPNIMKVKSKDVYTKRFTFILKDLINLPKYYFKIIGYLWAQKTTVSKYHDYLEKIIEIAEEKSKS